MVFKKMLMKLRRTFFCCSKHKRMSSLDIGSPTNVRRVDISDALPGLTDAERKYIREKASSDAIHLLGIQSHTTSRSNTSPPSPASSLGPASGPPSREPSETLLNAASKDFPSALPTPPRQQHGETSPPAARMKSMWAAATEQSSSRDSSFDATPSDKLQHVPGDEKDGNKDVNASLTTLNVEFDWEDKKHSGETARSCSFTGGFETQGTVGGAAKEMVVPSTGFKTAVPLANSPGAKQRGAPSSVSASSGSEADVFVAAESSPLVRH